MPLTGSSSILIQPCYDGRTLPGVQYVAGDGLSAISIKQSHRNCKFMRDPASNQPRISCAQGIKARNSFWNLHKPDLRKVRGLECATTESVTQVFQAHNMDNAGKPTYKKKMLRLLGSLVTKKSKASVRPEVLMPNGHWPAHMCVLSSICHEKEMKLSEGSNSLSLPEDEVISSTELMEDKLLNTAHTSHNLLSQLPTSETVYISLPSPGMLTMSSDNAFVAFNDHLKPSNNDNQPKSAAPFSKKAHSLLESEVSSSNQTVPSSLRLESKRSLAHIPDSWHPGYCDKNEFLYGKGENEVNASTINKTTLSNHNDERITDCINADSNTLSLESTNVVDKALAQAPSINEATEEAQSVVTDLLNEIQELDKFLNSYISSFCAREEEFENLPVLENVSPDTISHYLDQKSCPAKLKIYQNKNDMNRAASSTHMVCEVYKQNVKHALLECTQVEEHNTSVQEAINTEDNETTPHILEEATERIGNHNSRRAETENGLKENTLPGYCYWEDDIPLDPLGNTQPVSDYRSDASATEHSCLFTTKNTSLVPISFIEDTWKEFVESINKPTDENLGLDSPQGSSVEDFIPHYSHWARMYEKRFTEEAQNIVHSIDEFLNSMCLVDQGSASFFEKPTNVSIVEIDDEDELNSRSTENDRGQKNMYINSQEHASINLERSNFTETFYKGNTQWQSENDFAQQSTSNNNQECRDVYLQESQLNIAETFNKVSTHLQSDYKQPLIDMQEKSDNKPNVIDNYNISTVFIENDPSDSFENIEKSKTIVGLQNTVLKENVLHSENLKNVWSTFSILNMHKSDINASKNNSKANLKEYKHPSNDQQMIMYPKNTEQLSSSSRLLKDNFCDNAENSLEKLCTSADNYNISTVFVENDPADSFENIGKSKTIVGLQNTVLKENVSENLKSVWSTFSILNMHKSDINASKNNSKANLKDYKQPSNDQQMITNPKNTQHLSSSRLLKDNICDNAVNSFEKLCSSAEQIVQEKISRRYNVSDKGISSSNLARQISTISTNLVSGEKYSEIQDKNSNTGRSKYVKIPEKRNESTSDTDSQFIFSSPNVQLNLTNPLLNINKK